MAAHIAQWLVTGTTLSPLEPSEGMELAKHGVINTGLVFFVVMVGLTAVFGRFFCGWGCHLVALQDLSRWLLIKAGFTPRPLRSRLLGLVPIAAFVYMFLWPAVYKLAVGEPLGPLSTAFMTSEFWVTFPGLVVAVATFVICGFAIVFVLGSKGYCTYGCPYGAAFDFADRLAPMRVRVTNACAGCATCTSVCTSNVVVHREVRDHSMVVNSGCMKCLDCVASCPNEALFVGWGRPAVGRGAADRGSGGLRLGEELLAGGVFVAAFVVFRGLYGLVPFLFALGLAAISAGLVVYSVRVGTRPNVRLGPLHLKHDGRLSLAGFAWLAVTALTIGLWFHGVVLHIVERQSEVRFEATSDLRNEALQPGKAVTPLGPDDRQHTEDALRSVALLDRLSLGASAEDEYRRAWLAFLNGRLDDAGTSVDRALRHRPDDARAHLLAARLLEIRSRLTEAAGAYARAAELDPTNPAGFLGHGMMLGRSGQIAEALTVFERGLDAHPESLDIRYNVGLSMALLGRIDEAVGAFKGVLAIDPNHLPARENLAGMLAASGRFEEAVEVFEEAVRRSPDDPQLRVMAARACLGAGDRARAAAHVEAAIGLDPTLVEVRRFLD